MDADISEIVERLRRSRSTRLLRVIDDADPDGPVIAEPNLPRSSRRIGGCSSR